MASPFELPIILMQIIAALFGIFIAIFVLVLQLIPDDNDKEIYKTNALKKEMYNKYESRFFYILCLVLIFEFFNAIIAYAVTDKTFKDFYHFEICSYVGFILIFTLITQHIYDLILISIAFKKHEFDLYFTSKDYSNRSSNFNQVTLFLAINFLFIGFYFYLTKRLPSSYSGVILSIIFCVLAGLFIWNLIQQSIWKIAIVLFSEFLRKLLSTVLKVDVICVFLLLSYFNYNSILTLIAKFADADPVNPIFKQQPILIPLSAGIIPLILLLIIRYNITRYNNRICTSHKLSIEKISFHALSIVVVGMLLVGLYIHSSTENENHKWKQFVQVENINSSNLLVTIEKSAQSDYLHTEFEINRPNLLSWRTIGYILDHLNKSDKAIIVYEHAIKINPRDSVSWYNKGVNLQILDRYEEALGALNKSIEIDPKNSYSWLNKGFSLVELKKPNEAIRAFDNAIELDSQNAYVWAGKGLALNRLGKYDEALRALNKSIELDPKNSYGWLYKGFSLVELKKPNEAIRAFNNAIELDSQNAYAWDGKGIALKRLGKYDETLKAFDKAIKVNPQNSLFFEGNGIALGNLNKSDEEINALVIK
jgi:tetratricopeptide (TPR) repeat protein